MTIQVDFENITLSTRNQLHKYKQYGFTQTRQPFLKLYMYVSLCVGSIHMIANACEEENKSSGVILLDIF